MCYQSRPQSVPSLFNWRWLFCTDKQYARVVLWGQNSGSLFAARHADTEVLSGLVVNLSTGVEPHDTVEIRHDLTFDNARPTFEDNHLAELFALGLVHVHHHHARFRLGVGGEMFPHESTLRDRQAVGIGTVVPPVLRKVLSELCPALKKANSAGRVVCASTAKHARASGWTHRCPAGARSGVTDGAAGSTPRSSRTGRLRSGVPSRGSALHPGSPSSH